MSNRWSQLAFQTVVAGLLTLTLWLLPVMIIAQESGDNSEDAGEQRDQLEELSEQSAELRQEIAEMEAAEDLASDELREIDSGLCLARERLATTTRNYETKRSLVDQLNEVHVQAVADLEAAQKRFEARLVEWYKSGAGSMLSSLITTGDLSDFLFAMSYTEAIIENDRETIDFIREQKGRIFEERERLDAEIAECERLIGELREEETRYEELQARRHARLSQIAGDVHAAERALEEMEAASYEIAMILQVSQYTGTVGRLIKPVDAAFGSGFGMRRHPILGIMRAHSGVDMGAPGGTPIHAAGSGRVVYSGWKRGYGYTVTIDHGSGLATLYAHCSSLLVTVGETVSRGQVIARVGSTGLSTGNHLHFEVRINGDPVDPVPYLTGG